MEKKKRKKECIAEKNEEGKKRRKEKKKKRNLGKASEITLPSIPGYLSFLATTIFI
jgi:hypothetical protein